MSQTSPWAARNASAADPTATAARHSKLMDYGTGQFAVVSAQGNQPRMVQFALKVVR